MAEYRGNQSTSYGNRQLPSYTRAQGESTGLEYGGGSYGRQMNTPPRIASSPTPAGSQMTPTYTYPSGTTTYTTPSLTRYNPAPSSPTITRTNPQPYGAPQQQAIPNHYRQDSYQAVPLSNPDTFRPGYPDYPESTRRIPQTQSQTPQNAQPQQRISYARMQGNFNSPTGSTIQNSSSSAIGQPNFQPAVQRQPSQQYSMSQQNITNRSVSATPGANRFQPAAAPANFGVQRDRTEGLQEMWNSLEGNRDLQRTAKNMLTESVEMLVAISRALTSALLEGKDMMDLAGAHKRGIELWRQEIARKYPVESPFALREWIGKDSDFLSDLANGFKKRGDSSSRNREKTIHLERSASNMQTGFIEIDSGIQTPSSSRGQQPLVLKIVMDDAGSGSYSNQAGFTQNTVQKTQSRPYLTQSKTPEKQVSNRLYRYLEPNSPNKGQTAPKSPTHQPSEAQQLGSVTKQDALYSSTGHEVDRDLIEHRKKVQNRFSPFKRDTGPQGDFDMILTSDNKAQNLDGDKYSKFNQKVLAEAEIFRKHQVAHNNPAQQSGQHQERRNRGV